MKVRTKKISKILLLILLIILSILVCFVIKMYKNTINISKDCYTIVEEKSSPNNKKTALVLLYNGGITTDWQVLVVVKDENSIFSNRATTAFLANHANIANINWVDDSNLEIYYNINSEDILIDKNKVDKINITYEIDNNLPKLR